MNKTSTLRGFMLDTCQNGPYHVAGFSPDEIWYGSVMGVPFGLCF